MLNGIPMEYSLKIKDNYIGCLNFKKIFLNNGFLLKAKKLRVKNMKNYENIS